MEFVIMCYVLVILFVMVLNCLLNYWNNIAYNIEWWREETRPIKILIKEIMEGVR